MNFKLPFLRGIDLPLDLSPGLSQLSEEEFINMNLKLPFQRGVDLPLDLPPGLPELLEEESICIRNLSA